MRHLVLAMFACVLFQIFTGLICRGANCAAEDEQPPASEQQFFTQGNGYKYVGNSFSMKFHRPSCIFARRMWPEHIVLFRYRREAIEQGQKPCNYCLPQHWTTVHAVILNRDAYEEETSKTVGATPCVACPKETD